MFEFTRTNLGTYEYAYTKYRGYEIELQPRGKYTDFCVYKDGDLFGLSLVIKRPLDYILSNTNFLTRLWKTFIFNA